MGVGVTFLTDRDVRPGSKGEPAASATVSVPREAVRDVGGKPVVFVLEGGRVAMRAVSPRPLEGDRVSVSGGLAPGELVVVGGPPSLKDRDRVKVR
jgi:multidrug efflux pump subunit AcrA (membrane-fusion protein)